MFKTVLVTGGFGFIGSHIVEKLLAQQYKVIVIDDFSTGKKENIEHISPDMKIFKCSILDTEFEKIVLKEKPDVIIHQAAQVSVQNSINDMMNDEEINIRGSINVIQAAVKANVKKIIFSSTAAVYGIPEYLPINTSHPISPISPYGVSKYTVEKYLEVAHHLYGMDYTILRYSNVYGPRQDALGEGGVISIFVHGLISGEDIFIYGDGKQTRDFIYVEDVANANVQAINLGSQGVFNVSTNVECTINQVYELLLCIGNKVASPHYEQTRDGDIKNSVLCNEKTKRVLEWEPTFSLENGLKKTYKYYLRQFNPTLQ
ncbi:NAD-dependent epimerase/dehydratase family protein [Robertmurraya massiliosenegalensis]|uniref:NAD-dependent epimerase/dehydratase family protein n=1 Tax=Robertmurraya TaxID=2837507 RepID=UPI0039A6428E